MTFNAANTESDPGVLYWAPLSSVEPTVASGTPSGAWTQIGFTEQGHDFDMNVSSTSLFVAEASDPVKIVNPQRESTVSFAMAEVTLANLKLALGGGTITGSSPNAKFEPLLNANDAQRVMLLWQSTDLSRMYIYRQAVQKGSVKVTHTKAKLTTYTVQFGLEVPNSGSALFVSYGV